MSIERIAKGMNVVDVGGNKVGVVEDFKFGDSTASSSQGQDDLLDSGGSSHRIVVAPIEGFPIVMDPKTLQHPDLGDLPAEQAERFLHGGYIKVKAGHIIHSHRFFGSDDIARVDAEGVCLNRAVN